MIHAENSTNVRLEKAPARVDTRRPAPRAPALLRGALAAAQVVAPELAAAAAERLFLRPPPRRPAGDDETSVLAMADRFVVPHVDSYLTVWRWGAGAPVLLLHGWGGSAAQLTPLVAPLVARGFSPVAFDAPGHGESTGASSSLPQFASALARVTAAVGPPRGIIAHSLGAAATALAVADGLRVGRAVFVGPPADARVWLHQFGDALGLGEDGRRRLRERVERRLGVPFARLHAGATGPALTMPLLVIHDRHDGEVPFAAGEHVARTAARAELWPTTGLGHRRILRDPTVIARAVAFVGDGLS